MPLTPRLRLVQLVVVPPPPTTQMSEPGPPSRTLVAVRGGLIENLIAFAATTDEDVGVQFRGVIDHPHRAADFRWQGWPGLQTRNERESAPHGSPPGCWTRLNLNVSSAPQVSAEPQSRGDGTEDLLPCDLVDLLELVQSTYRLPAVDQFPRGILSLC